MTQCQKACWSSTDLFTVSSQITIDELRTIIANKIKLEANQFKIEFYDTDFQAYRVLRSVQELPPT